MCRVSQQLNSLDDSNSWNSFSENASRALIAVIALAAITMFALCFIENLHLPKNLFNKDVVWVYGTIGILSLSLFVHLVRDREEDISDSPGLGPRKSIHHRQEEQQDEQVNIDPPDLHRRKSRPWADVPDEEDAELS